MILLLLPISLLFFNKMTDKDVTNIFKSYASLLFPFIGGIINILIAILIFVTKKRVKQKESKKVND